MPTPEVPIPNTQSYTDLPFPERKSGLLGLQETFERVKNGVLPTHPAVERMYFDLETIVVTAVILLAGQMILGGRLLSIGENQASSRVNISPILPYVNSYTIYHAKRGINATKRALLSGIRKVALLSFPKNFML